MQHDVFLESDVSQPSVRASETPAQRRQRGQWLDALAAPATRARRLAGVAVAVSGVLLLAQAAAIAWLLQAVLVQHLALAQLRDVGAGLVCALVGRALLNAWAQSLTGEVADVARRELRARIARRLVQHGPVWLRRQRSGELGELSLAHTDALEGYFVGYQLARTEMLLVPPLILIAVFSVDWVVGLVLLLTAPLIPFFMMLVGWGAEAAGRDQLRELARMGGHFADRLKGLGLLRVYGRGEAELSGIAAAAEGVRERSLKVLRIAFLSSTVLEFFASVSVAIVALYFGLTYLGMLDLHGLPTLGAGMFCLLLAPEFFAPLRRLAAHYHDRANALAAVAEAERLLEGFAPSSAALPVTVPPLRALEPAQAHAPLLQARDLALRPPGAPHTVVAHFSLTLQPGQRVAVIGASGSGKSTLLEGLAGWLAPEAGSVVLRPGTRIGYATQRPYLFHGSIADNLRLADPQAGAARLHAVADAAQVLRFAAQLPAGLDTQIGERGFGLSGGEARRVALARLLLREPDLLLLDEPTAFLDPDTEAELLRTLGVFARGRAVVLATHSAEVMRWADTVVDLRGATVAAELP
ncbi:thiol reductant ABC exporter subunit CydD [Xanthomonas arboricola pv. juglandis]|uniref:thiol reductant ABC exporter subunit CydD n=1 Tax=Xanthomonas arboricola TaxID=56448 RepID=UPI0009B642E7|nr:thiol reductant ABC exporter subunit CydD [Xanthomonas arboricola]MDN0219510.1 thiol reductant ABC exporter subunit CydD [Xanthomonas arboricola pv. juglandis]MDN0224157.1 thiol reductant ABC exporter subunit CydD [Xanthomonas arboricola pv. juglandis]MDN0228337.1 thiol reductant ABC exporter subunit CydD [Xanthomonas arboricola pv. juglandis]MDN0232476.1 thiol reductant ABC exporter subunit CydD [Xanthomonas arboricola pv. juglandis]MDN0237037.1 thiol reductant ABC exporter subunit CydD [X